MRSRRDLVGRVLIGVVVALALGGCGGAAESSGASEPAPAPSPVAPVTSEATVDASTRPSEASADVVAVLGEWVVELTPTEVAAGPVTIAADNGGGEDHELVVVRAEDAADLPTDADGAVDEARLAPDDIIGEVEDLSSGDRGTLTATLEPGTYVAFCNIVEVEHEGDEDEGGEHDGAEEIESHFANGMHATLTVE